MSIKRSVFGFGFRPEEAQHHFLVRIHRMKKTTSVIYERFDWQDELSYNGKAKAEISKEKWELLESAVQTEFNDRLKKQGLPAGRFVVGQTPLERMLGKELLVLVWAIEDCDLAVVPLAIRNWLGLAPEERWWLYTMTNALTGNVDDRRGWRKALRYALCENY